MINESYYWKKPLLESALRLKDFQYLSEINDEEYVQIEKDIFLGFYSIRKLLDAETKVTDSLKSEKHELSWFEHVGDNVTWNNNHKLDELYNLNGSHTENRDLWFISSRIIHSFIFNLCINENGGFDGILFTSDTDKNKKLYMLTSAKIINIFELVGNNQVKHIERHRCPETGEEFTSAK